MSIRALLVTFVLAGAAPLAAQVPGLDIDLRAGLNSTSISETPAGFEDRNPNTNYFIGGDVRFGEFFFIQPGLYYQKQGFTLEAGDADLDIGVSSVMVPLQVGLNLAIPLVAIEAAAGPTVAFNTSQDGVLEDELNNTRFGALISAKFKVVFIAAFVGYQWDFTNTFSADGADGHLSQWMLGLGVNF